ncbi:MAG TPA: alpha/beta hydrolase [Candidatus Nanoarchaeia archaeon]|nr:alpha/beta hydrolase [Candidatus Nanoarchaeia archaeon]
MLKKKPQIVYIHGGMTFRNKNDYLKFLKTRKISTEEKKRWSDEYLKRNFGRYCEIIKPRMPLQDYSKYAEWKIHFERYIPKIKNSVILIGSSLGGIFLAKYLSENKFPKEILSVYLVCPPFDDTLPTEDLAGGFKLKSDLSILEKNARNLNLFFSKDDDIVPVSHAKKYKNRLKNANILIHKKANGHFKISKFPEIIMMIKKDLKRI